MDSLDYYKLLVEGHRRKQIEERERDLNNPPAFRGGQSGCMYNGFVIGSIPQEAVLRYLKITSPIEFDQQLLFDAGFGNEDSHNALLEAADVAFKCEEEIPISWTTSNGYTVTGRPDRALMDGDRISLIIEEKQIASSWKTKTMSNWGMAQPKDENVVQAAHYMWQHGKVDGMLVYTSRAWHALKGKKEDFLDPDHRALLGDGDWTYGVKPFMSLYKLTWQGDVLHVDGKPTKITVAGIQEYYQMLGDCVTNRTIPDYHYKDMWGGAVNRKKKEQYYNWIQVPTDDWDTWLDQITDEVNAQWEKLHEPE